MIQRRDTAVLIIAIVCGLLAFSLVMNMLKKSSRASGRAVAAGAKDPSGSLPIPSGMSALTLSPQEMENIPDLLSVGSFVDILGVAPNYSGKLELQAIVRSAQIINLDKKEGQPIGSITVAISPVGAEVVSKATAQGKLHLILRPEGGEKSVLQLGGVGLTEVIRGVDKDKSMRLDR